MAKLIATVKCPWCGEEISATLTPVAQMQGYLYTECDACKKHVKIRPQVCYIAEKYRINEELGILGE